MLWQGQEFGENYWLPPGGIGRVMLLRPVRWDYFYDETGKATVRLVRRLLSIRREHEDSAAASDFFYNQWDRYQCEVLLFSRPRETASVWWR